MTSYLKAIVGALIAGLGSLYQALDKGGVTAQEWVAVAIATLAALGVVWGTPNLDPKGKRQRESVMPPGDRGAVDLTTVLVVVVLVVLLLVLLGAVR
jgi:hypothetical protein